MIRLLLLLIAGLWFAMANADKFGGPERRTVANDAVNDAAASARTSSQADPDVVQVSLPAQPAKQPSRIVELRRFPTETANMVSFSNPVVIGDDGKIIAPSDEPGLAEAGNDAVAADPDEPMIAILYVNASRVNVRAGPSTTNSVIGSVDFADALQILSDPTEDWVKIRVEGDGVEGFMASRFLTESAPPG